MPNELFYFPSGKVDQLSQVNSADLIDMNEYVEENYQEDDSIGIEYFQYLSDCIRYITCH